MEGGGGVERSIFYLDVLAILCTKQPGGLVNMQHGLAGSVGDSHSDGG